MIMVSAISLNKNKLGCNYFLTFKLLLKTCWKCLKELVFRDSDNAFIIFLEVLIELN